MVHFGLKTYTQYYHSSSVYVGNTAGNFRTDNNKIKWIEAINGMPYDRVTTLVTKWTSKEVFR